MFDLIKLQYFVTIAKYENISEASKELHVSQPALSKAISHLENEIGISLFNRQGKKLYLNKNGSFFKTKAEKLLASAENVKKELDDLNGETQKNVSIITTLPYTAIELFNGFLEIYADTKLLQVSLSSENLADFIERGKYDLCIHTEKIEHSNLEWIPLIEEPIFLSVPMNHKLAQHNTVTIDDLKDEELSYIGLPKSFAFRKLTDELCSYPLSYKVEVEEPTAILQLVRHGKGISFSPATAVHLYRDNIKHIPIDDTSFKRTIGILKHKYYYQTARSKSFIQYCMDFFEHYREN